MQGCLIRAAAEEEATVLECYYFQPLGSNSGRVYLALLEKGVAFIGHELDGPGFEHHQPAYLKVNPKGQVPCIVHDGLTITEGTAINEYIDGAFDGPSLRPDDLHERWNMRRWCRFIDADLGRSVMMVHWNRIVPSFVGARSDGELKEILARVADPDRRRSWEAAFTQSTPPDKMAESRRRMEVASLKIEEQLQETPYLAGLTYSLADIDLLNFYGFFPDWFPELANADRTPATMAWIRTVEQRTAVKLFRERRTLPVQRPAAA